MQPINSDFAMMPEPLLLMLIAMVGLVFGSFITAISYRMAHELPWVAVRSICPKCNNTLKSRDLIPVLSWLIARARCRQCSAPIHWRYPVVELVTAASFVALYMFYGLNVEFALMTLLAVNIIALIVTDFEHYIIPNELQVAMGVIGVARILLLGLAWEPFIYGALLGFAIGCALHYGYYFLRGRHGLGFGDVKFLAVAGIWLGYMPLVPFLFFAGIIGIFTALIWRILGRGEHFPFGPALAVSMLLLLLYPAIGDAFWNIGDWVAY